MKRLTLLLTCFFISMGLAIAQNQKVSGVVTDMNGDVVIGASVIVKGNASIGTVTNADGQFSLDVPSTVKTLTVKYLGFIDQDVAVGQNLRIVMKESSTELDEVLVVAYGTVKKESFTGSAGQVSAAKLEKRTVSNVTKALEGTIPGIMTTSGSGQPGSGASIMVRGFGSINAASTPLYVVDGAPYDGSITAINPEDIASVTVLKDASAGALYGNRGANGVVMITTKRGGDKAGKASVELKALWGVASRAIPRYDLMDEKAFIETNFLMYKNEQIYKNGIDPAKAGAAAIAAMSTGGNRLFGANEQYNPYNMPIAQLIDPVTGQVNPNAQLRWSQDWLDEVMAENPLRQEYTLSISGGNEKTKYYTSFNYLNEEGILETSSFERIAGRINVDSQLREYLKFGGSTNFSLNKSNSYDASGTGTTNPWYTAQNMGPIYPVYELDENYNIVYKDGKPIYDYGVNRPNGAGQNSNVVSVLYDDKYYSNSDNLSAQGYLKLDLDNEKYGWAQGLNFTVNINASNQNARGTTYYNPTQGNAAATSGRLTKSATRMFSYTFNQLLGYNRSFGEHNIDLLAGHEYYSYQYNYLDGQRITFPFPELYELNPGAAVGTLPSSYENNYRLESYLARAKYSYGTRYNVDASIRTDGSSRFNTDYRWGTFWSAGANWRISEEAFMEDVEWLNNLNVRASYGVQGNDNVGTLYAWQSFYTLGLPNAQFNSSYLSSLENKTLLWEKNGNFNVGVDARMLNNRVSATIEYFNRKTTDMLFSVPMATSLGFDSFLANIGNMRNTGVEVSLGFDVMKTSDFDWKLTLLGTSIKNEVLKLASETPIKSGSYITKVGEPYGCYYLPKSAGVDPATGKQLYWVWDEVDPITDERKSEPYISDSPSKAANSRECVGSKMPDFYGSIGSELRYKSFDFSFITMYSIGGKVLDGMYNSYMNPLYAGSNFHNNLSRAWKNPGDITDIPRVELNNGNTMTQSDLLDNSYFAIRNVVLGYTLPSKVAKKAGLSRLRVFVTGDNLITFCHLDGYDPIASMTGSLTYNYVPTRTISLGINVGF